MGFNISEIVQGSAWKNFMKYMYGWGAALVLTGALFKLQYWPGAGTMLTIGMTAEVFIFFFSAFEPIHDEVDWTLVYPELAGMTDEEELRKYRKGSGMAGGLDPDDIKELIAGVVAATSNLPAANNASQPASGDQQQGDSIPRPKADAGVSMLSNKVANMFENAEISPEMFEKLNKGLSKLAETSEKLADISDAALASNGYTESMRKAAETVTGFSDNYSQSGQVLSESMNILSENFQKTAGTISQGGDGFLNGINKSVGSLENKLSEAGEEVKGRIVSSGEEIANQLSQSAGGLSSTYQQMAESMKANGEVINSGSSDYQDKLAALNKNMSALNAAHELHLQGVSEKLKDSEAVYSETESMMKKLKSSIQATEQYSESVALLNKNIADLNSIYGNMLSAITVMK